MALKSRNGSRSRILVLVLAGALLLCSCGGNEHRGAVIGLSQCTLDDAWRQAMIREMKIELSNYDDLDLVVSDARNDPQRQAEQIRELIARKVDVLVISPFESQALTAVTEEAYRSGIPVIVTDRKVETDRYTTFIGADNYAIGHQAGEAAAARFFSTDRRPEILEVWGLRSSSPAQERHAGFADALKENGIEARFTPVDGQWLEHVVEREIVRIGHPGRFDAVYSHNDVMAIAVRKWFVKTDTLRAGRIPVIGVDAVAGAGLEAVADGLIDLSFLYPTGGVEVVRTARRILNGEKVPPLIRLSSATVDGATAETMLLQAHRLSEYEQSITAKKERLDRLSKRIGSMRLSMIVIGLLCLALASALLVIFRANRKIRQRNALLDRKSRHEEEQNRKLLALNNEIKQTTAQKLQFFTNLSHEIRTPLTLILAPIGKLLGALRGTDYAYDLELMQRNAIRLLKEINQMLDFRRLENGRQTLTREKVLVKAFVEDIKCYFDGLARQRHTDYRFHYRSAPGAPPDFALDKDLMEKTLINLLSNAFKYTSGRVTLRVENAAREIIIVVEDDGCGIPHERLPHVFERFMTDNNAVGTGIGLHLVHEYVALHGGRADVESEPGRFTRFTIRLPRPAEAPHEERRGGAFRRRTAYRRRASQGTPYPKIPTRKTPCRKTPAPRSPCRRPRKTPTRRSSSPRTPCRGRAKRSCGSCSAGNTITAS